MSRAVGYKDKERLQDARRVPIVDYLDKIGYPTVRKSRTYALYSSPLRADRNPSFVVNKVKNKWNDYAREDQHGDILDLVMQLEEVNLPQAIDILLGQEIPSKKYEPLEEEKKEAVWVHENKDISDYRLIAYLYKRKIPLELARENLRELLVSFPNGSTPNKRYAVLGFQNDSKGYELRSENIKLSKAPKNITTIRGENADICFFEGFMDYLSALKFYKVSRFRETVIVLNTLAFLRSIMPFFEKNLKFMFIDNDEAASKVLKELKQEGIEFTDARYVYQGYKDFNEFITK